MQKVIVQIDWYTKIILTLITVLLAGVVVKSYFPSHIREARASDMRNMARKLKDQMGSSSSGPLTEPESIRRKRDATVEGSRVLVDCLYLFNLQNLSKERALETIDESPIFSAYPAGKEYAKFLVVTGRNEVYQEHLSDEAIKTALLSGRFEVTPHGIVPRPLKVEVINGSIVK